MESLREAKFPYNVVNYMMHVVTSVETNVKWNGAISEFFRPKRGIRHRDPLSPYLFILCMDKLSHLIMEDVSKDKWKAMKTGKDGPRISHLMFVDDL